MDEILAAYGTDIAEDRNVSEASHLSSNQRPNQEISDSANININTNDNANQKFQITHKRTFPDDESISYEQQLKRSKYELPSTEVKHRYISKKERKQLEQQTNNEQMSQPQSIISWNCPNKFTDLPPRLRHLIQEEDISKFVNRIPQSREMELHSHQLGVNCVRWSLPHGHLLASASMDQTVGIFDPFRTKKQIVTLRHHKGAVKDVQWNCDSSRLLTAGFDKYAKLIDVETAKVIQEFEHSEFVTTVKYHPSHHNLFLAGCFKDGVLCWDIRTRR
jgi:hypothetical protein